MLVTSRLAHFPRWASLCFLAVLGSAQTADSSWRETTFEELSNITVITASKHEERLFDTPAAVFVLSGDEVQRTGATSIAEALRWVPGLDVAQLNAADWAVSGRGFNDLFSNKLLVMMDGRSVYTPLFAGVHWDAVNPMLEDLDRIEVVRGPGGALWGANAVNGVINILSKSARDTQGTLVYGSGGTEKTVLSGVRHGWALNDHSWMRVYATYQRVDESRFADATPGHDGFHAVQGGFRFDSAPAGARFTLQGDVFSNRRDRITTLVTPAGVVTTDHPHQADGFNLQGRWTRELSAESTLAVQAYWDHTKRDLVTVTERRDTFDLDFQHHVKAGERHDLTWGLGYRFSGDRTKRGPTGGFDPADYDFQLFSGFAQDEIALVPSRLKAALGAKLEHNSFTGFEFLPSARLLWTPDEHRTFWAGVSRAVRNPNRADDAVTFDTAYLPAGPGQPLPLLIRALGNPQVDSESLVAWEAGWRIQPQPNWSVDLSVFYNDYDKVILGVPDATGIFAELTPGPPHLVAPVYLINGARVCSHGGELSFTWQPAPGVRLSPFYSFLKMSAELIENGNPYASVLTESAPKHQAGLRVSFDLSARAKLDFNLRWIGEVPVYAVPAYAELDVRFAWEIRPGWECVLSGQNLLHPRHPEFGPRLLESRFELQRGVQLKLAHRF